MSKFKRRKPSRDPDDNKRGRRCNYYSHIYPRLEEIKSWYFKGALDKEVMKALGVSRASFYVYMHKYPDFRAAISKWKCVPDHQVEAALYKRAIGYTYTESKQSENGLGSTIEVTTKQLPGDVTAMRYWLNNRVSTQWRDKQYVEHGVSLQEVLNALPGDLAKSVRKALAQSLRDK